MYKLVRHENSFGQVDSKNLIQPADIDLGSFKPTHYLKKKLLNRVKRDITFFYFY